MGGGKNLKDLRGLDRLCPTPGGRFWGMMILDDGLGLRVDGRVAIRDSGISRFLMRFRPVGHVCGWSPAGTVAVRGWHVSSKGYVKGGGELGGFAAFRRFFRFSPVFCGGGRGRESSKLTSAKLQASTGSQAPASERMQWWIGQRNFEFQYRRKFAAGWFKKRAKGVGFAAFRRFFRFSSVFCGGGEGKEKHRIQKRQIPTASWAIWRITLAGAMLSNGGESLSFSVGGSPTDTGGSPVVPSPSRAKEGDYE
jgi:hypothetical protein